MALRVRTGVAVKPLLQALPKEFIRSTLSVNHSSPAVFAGNKEQVVRVLKLKPSDIVPSAPIWWACVFQVMSDRLRLQIHAVSAVISNVIVEGSHLLFVRTGGRPIDERLASTLNVYLDRHPAGRIVNENSRWMIIRKVKSGVCALHRNQSPSSYQLLASTVLLRFSGEQANAGDEHHQDVGFAHECA